MNLNKLHNIRNPYQGNSTKVLCLCSAGLLRSPTAAVVLQREYGYNTRSAGVTEDYALIDATEPLLRWADEIVVMEEWMGHLLPDFCTDKVYCLDVPDNYAYMDEELQKIIHKKYSQIVLGEDVDAA